MTNPLSGLKPALEVLAQSVDILPATGQAVEDLLRPDHEEVEDSILSREDKRIEIIGELPHGGGDASFRMQHFLYFLPLPHGQGSLGRIFLPSRRTVSGLPVTVSRSPESRRSSGATSCRRRTSSSPSRSATR